MKWVSALSEKRSASSALEECVRQVREADASAPDLALLFASIHHAADYPRLASLVVGQVAPRAMIGCSAGGVIAGGKEVEQKPAMGVVCAWLPGVAARPFHVEQESLPSPDAPPKAWADLVGVPDRASKPAFILLSDPFSLDVEELAQGLDYAFAGSVKVGGLASGATEPGGNVLYMDGAALKTGAVGVALTGNVVVDPIVAQGCRPVGAPMRVTACERNLLLELDGDPPLKVLKELFESMSATDRRLARTALFLGILNDPRSPADSKRDYLVRNLIGMDAERGILAVGAHLRPGQTVQFHVRDRKTADHDLGELVTRYHKAGQATKARGALLFSCVGRGEGLYGKPDHDSDLFRSLMGDLPLGGFFCNGEIGPVAGTTYLHGFTSCFGIFRPSQEG